MKKLLFYFFCRTMLTHEPCDRHSYAAYWLRDLEQRPVSSKVSGFTDFLKKHDIGVFEGDKSFFLLNHQFIMLGKKKKKKKLKNKNKIKIKRGVFRTTQGP